MTTQPNNVETQAAGAISRFLDTHFPPNRVVTLLGPVVAIVSGAVASWLSTHFPGLGLDTSTTAGAVTQGINFAIGALVTLALQHKWLAGWQQYQATVAASGASTPSAVTTSPPLQPQGVYDPALNVPTTVVALAAPGAADVAAGPPEGAGSANDGAE
jgi:hypothetical protein